MWSSMRAKSATCHSLSDTLYASICKYRRKTETNLILDKLWPQQRPRLTPPLPIEREDSIAQKRVELLIPIPQTKILELRRQHRLDILRFPRGHDSLPEDGEGEGVSAEVLKPGDLVFEEAFLLHGTLHVDEGQDAEEDVIPSSDWFAVQGFGAFSVVMEVVEVLEGEEGKGECGDDDNGEHFFLQTYSSLQS